MGCDAITAFIIGSLSGSALMRLRPHNTLTALRSTRDADALSTCQLLFAYSRVA